MVSDTFHISPVRFSYIFPAFVNVFNSDIKSFIVLFALLAQQFVVVIATIGEATPVNASVTLLFSVQYVLFFRISIPCASQKAPAGQEFLSFASPHWKDDMMIGFVAIMLLLD